MAASQVTVRILYEKAMVESMGDLTLVFQSLPCRSLDSVSSISLPGHTANSDKAANSDASCCGRVRGPKTLCRAAPRHTCAEHEETEEFQKSALCGEGMLKVQSDLYNPVDARVEMDDEKDG